MKNCSSCKENKVPSCLEIVPIFRMLSYEEMDEIAMLTNHKKYKKGDFIYTTGNINHKLYVLHKGKIKISRYTEDGKEQIIRIISPGDFLGELTIFSGSASSDNAEVLEDANVCMIEGSDLKTYIIKHPIIGFKMMEELSKRLETLEGMIEDIALKSVEIRIVEYLLKNVNEFNEVELITTKGNFASQIGMSKETLSRKLGKLEDEGIIRLVGQRKIIILSKSKLEDIL